MFCLESAGINCFDITTRHGAYCGVIAQRPNGAWRVYFNSNATRGSKRSFATAEEAIAFIYKRRVDKGWRV